MTNECFSHSVLELEMFSTHWGKVDTFGSRHCLKDVFTAQKLEDVQHHNSECFIKIAMNTTDEYGFPGVLNTYKFLNI